MSPTRLHIAFMPFEQQPKKSTFVTFRDKFIELISSPQFGEPAKNQPENSRPIESAAHRELRTAELVLRLRNRNFLRTVYRLVLEHARLEAEKPKVRTVARTARHHVTDFRNAQKRLAGSKLHLEKFAVHYDRLLDPDLKKSIDRALEHIDAIIGVLINDAKKRLISLASDKPGEYFIWDLSKHKFIEKLEESA